MLAVNGYFRWREKNANRWGRTGDARRMTEWVVETPRLGMRRLTEADRPALAGLDWLETDRLLERCLADYETRGHALWALVRKADRDFVGLCGLLAQDVEGCSELEVGYHLLPAYRRRGLAAEAARGVMAYAFHRLGAARIISIILPDNTASIGVALSNGLRFERSACFRGLGVSIYAARPDALEASAGESP